MEQMVEWLMRCTMVPKIMNSIPAGSLCCMVYPYNNALTRGGQSVAHAPNVVHCVVRSGALHG